MPKIPNRNYSVPEADEKKLYAVTYQYQLGNGDWFADTWTTTAKNISEALETTDAFCNGTLETGYWVAYEITNINVIRR